MKTLTAVSVVSSARLAAAVMGLAGLAAGMLYAFGGALFDTLVTLGWVASAESGSLSTPGLGWGTVLAFGALVGMPLIFAAAGLVAGTVGAILYNVVARRVGGIVLHFD
ncbi:MAG: hypothetical protein OXN15_04730 [Chloroflexota bacterium]|nr:hypothetical protein [Chloroflexota bacterium]MDE2970448.1 hypothetical protein [Chloroflexota bacterium]